MDDCPTTLTEAMESAMRECWSYESESRKGGYGYRFRQATMLKCESAGWAKRLDAHLKRPRWVLTEAGKARLRGQHSCANGKPE